MNWRGYEIVPISEIVGKTFVSVENKGNEELIFTESDGTRYKLFHEKDCCESVTIEDICGELSDLVDTPILEAREDTNSTDRPTDRYVDSFTWTFYNFQTAKGHVTIRWYGESNGYYSESVDFVKMEVSPNA